MKQIKRMIYSFICPFIYYYNDKKEEITNLKEQELINNIKKK